MGRVKIVTDSTCDIPPEWIRELDITVLPCDIIFGQEVFQEGVDLTTQEFYSRLNEGHVWPTLGLFAETYERLGRQGEGIVSIHISSLLSGIYETACQAAEALPDLEIAVIDSYQLSMALG